MKKWVTSDPHYGHKNIAGPTVSNWKSGYRDFESVEEMNKTLITTFNKYVQPEDILYILGDFVMGGYKNTPIFRSALKCQTIHLITGNHDGPLIEHYQGYFTSVQPVLQMWHQGQSYFMSHYAHRVWEGSHKGYIHLYGHSHGTIMDHGKSMDVGVDVAYKMFGEYRPFSIEEISKIMTKKEIAFVDGHNSETNVK